MAVPAPDVPGRGDGGPAPPRNDGGENTGGGPRAFVFAQVGPGVEQGINDMARCTLPTEVWLDIGKATAPVESSSTQGEATVSVTCSVLAEGAGFRVSASAALERRGAFTITGLVTAAEGTVTASFLRSDTGGFRQRDCELGDVEVAAGRVRGRVTCGQSQFTDGQDRVCLAVAEFAFDGCDG